MIWNVAEIIATLSTFVTLAGLPTHQSPDTPPSAPQHARLGFQFIATGHRIICHRRFPLQRPSRRIRPDAGR
jgi:hypothetical protein